MAGKYPQESYAAVFFEIQTECIYLQRTTEDTRHAFTGVMKLLWETFFLCLFFGKYKSLPPIVGTLSTMPVNKSGMVPQYMVTSSNNKYLSLICASCNLIGSVKGER